MKRLAAAAALAVLAACGTGEQPAPFDVRLTPRQYNDLASANDTAELPFQTCQNLCALPVGVFASGVSSCALAVSNEGLPLLRCVPFVVVGE